MSDRNRVEATLRAVSDLRAMARRLRRGPSTVRAAEKVDALATELHDALRVTHPQTLAALQDPHWVDDAAGRAYVEILEDDHS